MTKVIATHIVKYDKSYEKDNIAFLYETLLSDFYIHYLGSVNPSSAMITTKITEKEAKKLIK